MTTRMPCWACQRFGWELDGDEAAEPIEAPCEHCEDTGWTVTGRFVQSANMESKSEGDQE